MKRLSTIITAVLLITILAAPVVLSAEPAKTAPTVDAKAKFEQAKKDWVAKTTKEGKSSGDIVWTLIAAFLVFFMQAGFALVETGFTRAKNSVNIIMKNLMDFSMGAIAYFLVGFSLMFGPDLFGGVFGFAKIGIFSPNGLPMTKELVDAAGKAVTLLNQGLPVAVHFLDVPGCIRSNCGNNRFRSNGRKNKVLFLSCIQCLHLCCHISRIRSLDLGRRLAGKNGIHRLCRIHCCPLRGRLGSPYGSHGSRTASREIRTRRKITRHPRPQHSSCGPWCIHPLLRMVRIQPGLHS